MTVEQSFVFFKIHSFTVFCIKHYMQILLQVYIFILFFAKPKMIVKPEDSVATALWFFLHYHSACSSELPVKRLDQ